MKKYFYIVPLFLLLLALLGPAVYTGMIHNPDAPPVTAGGVREESGPNAGEAESSPAVGAGGSTAAGTGLSGPPVPDTVPAGQARGAAGEELSGPDPVPAAGQNASAAPPAGGPSRTGLAVNIAVVGKDGELLFGPAPVQVSAKSLWGATALGALDATGLSYEMAAGWGCLVVAVAGQYNRGQAGWMYEVNGEIPAVAADEKPLAANDEVIWWYSNSIATPAPTWSGLMENS